MQFFKNTDCKDYYFYCFLVTFSHRKCKSKKKTTDRYFLQILILSGRGGEVNFVTFNVRKTIGLV